MPKETAEVSQKGSGAAKAKTKAKTKAKQEPLSGGKRKRQ